MSWRILKNICYFIAFVYSIYTKGTGTKWLAFIYNPLANLGILKPFIHSFIHSFIFIYFYSSIYL